MKKLIKLMQRAHSIEIGAYHAYAGHWKSLKDSDPAKLHILNIQMDEMLHLLTVRRMLRQLGHKSNVTQDFVLWCIGKSIGIACLVMGRRAAMWGAKIMEVLGSKIYVDLAEEACENDLYLLASAFGEMANAENRHEKFFKEILSKRAKKSLTMESDPTP